MSGNMAFFFDLVALYLVALPGGPLPGGPLPGGSTWWLYLVALPGASMCCTLRHFAPPITPYYPSLNKMGQFYKIVVWIKKDSTNTMQINGLRYVK